MIVVTRPSEALRVAARPGNRISLLLADVRLPEMRGDELAKRMRAIAPDLPVVLMSGLADPPATNIPLVSKPIDFAALLRTIERALAESDDRNDG